MKSLKKILIIACLTLCSVDLALGSMRYNFKKSAALKSSRTEANYFDIFHEKAKETKWKPDRGFCHSSRPPMVGEKEPAMPSTWWSNMLEEGAQIQIRTKWQMWLGPINGDWSKGIIANNSKPPPVSQYFKVRRSANSFMALEAPNGNFLTIGDSGLLLPSSNDVNAESVFLVKQGLDHKIQLRGPQGQWLSAMEDGTLSWASLPSEYETFDVREVMTVPSIRGVNLGGWLVLEGWMKMSLFEGASELVDGAKVNLKSRKHGCFASAEFGGGAGVACRNGSWAGDWETFIIRREFPDTSEGRVLLRSASQWYCTAANESAGKAFTASMWHEPRSNGSSTFQIVEHPEDPSLIQLQAHDGTFLEAHPDNDLLTFTATSSWLPSSSSVFHLSVTGGLQGEWQLAAGLGQVAVRERLEKHRQEWVTEKDFGWLAEQGVNMVRIPVGYWITQGNNPDGTFVPGGLKYLDLAFDWAKKHDIRIMVDLHGLPGSQNGLAETGSRDGVPEFTRRGSHHISQALEAVEFLAQRYAEHSAFFALELINEPAATATPLDVLSQYYEEGFRLVRKYSPCVYVVVGNRWLSSDSEIKYFLQGQEYNNVIFDVHWYAYWMQNMAVDEIVEFWRNEKAPHLKKLSEDDRLVFIGEWSIGLPTNYETSNEDHRKFGMVQLETYAKYAKAGWAFWSIKLERTDMPAFSFTESRTNGWLPFEYVDRKIWDELHPQSFAISAM